MAGFYPCGTPNSMVLGPMLDIYQLLMMQCTAEDELVAQPIKEIICQVPKLIFALQSIAVDLQCLSYSNKIKAMPPQQQPFTKRVNELEGYPCPPPKPPQQPFTRRVNESQGYPCTPPKPPQQQSWKIRVDTSPRSRRSPRSAAGSTGQKMGDIMMKTNPLILASTPLQGNGNKPMPMSRDLSAVRGQNWNNAAYKTHTSFSSLNDEENSPMQHAEEPAVDPRNRTPPQMPVQEMDSYELFAIGVSDAHYMAMMDRREAMEGHFEYLNSMDDEEFRQYLDRVLLGEVKAIHANRPNH